MSAKSEEYVYHSHALSGPQLRAGWRTQIANPQFSEESLEKHWFHFRRIQLRCTVNNRRSMGLIWRLRGLTWVVSWEENSFRQHCELTGQFRIHDKSFVNGDGMAVEYRGKRKRTPRSAFPPVSTLVYRGVVTSVVCEWCLLYRLQLRRGVQS